MILEKKLMPDVTLSSFRELTPEVASSLGAKAVISDVDNTLAPYEVLDATEEVVRWAKALSDNGIALTLVSNNGKKRVERFCKAIGCNYHSRVKKPSSKYLFISMKEMNSEPSNTVFLGDQLLTDALAAHRAGMKAVIVPPIKDKRSLFFRLKRLIERPYMKKYLQKTEKDS